MFNPEKTTERTTKRTNSEREESMAAGGDDDVSFAETIEHLGGAAALVCSVLLLLVAYVALVEWFLPRRRLQTSVKQTRATAKRR
ncbi:hypothetical protein Gpo141_00008392 [Globisporangium polare]